MRLEHMSKTILSASMCPQEFPYLLSSHIFVLGSGIVWPHGIGCYLILPKGVLQKGGNCSELALDGPFVVQALLHNTVIKEMSISGNV